MRTTVSQQVTPPTKSLALYSIYLLFRLVDEKRPSQKYNAEKMEEAYISSQNSKASNVRGKLYCNRKLWLETWGSVVVQARLGHTYEERTCTWSKDR